MPPCPSCGNDLSPAAIACPRCGRDVGVTTAAGEPAPAAWWQRAVAQLIDAALLSIPLTVALLVFVGPSLPAQPGEELSTQTGDALVRLSVIAVGAGGLYKFLMEGARGQTVGKMAMRLWVRDARDGGQISYGQAFTRWLIFATLGWFIVTGLVNLLWPLWDRRRQALHDKPARTIVLHRP